MAENVSKNKKIVNYPCYKYVLKHMNKASQIPVFEKNYISTMHKRGVSEGNCVSGMRLMVSVPGACSIKKADFFGLYDVNTDEELYQYLVTNATIKEYKTCYEFYNVYSKAKGQSFDRKNSVCLTCPYSKRYANKETDFELSLLKMLYSLVLSGDKAKVNDIVGDIDNLYSTHYDKLTAADKKKVPAEFHLVSCKDLCEQWSELTPYVISISDLFYHAIISFAKDGISSLEESFSNALMLLKKVPSTITSHKNWKANLYKNILADIDTASDIELDSVMEILDSHYIEYIIDISSANDSGVKRGATKTVKAKTSSSSDAPSVSKPSDEGEGSLSDLLAYIYSLDYDDGSTAPEKPVSDVSKDDNAITENVSTISEPLTGNNIPEVVSSEPVVLDEEVIAVQDVSSNDDQGENTPDDNVIDLNSETFTEQSEYSDSDVLGGFSDEELPFALDDEDAEKPSDDNEDDTETTEIPVGVVSEDEGDARDEISDIPISEDKSENLNVSSSEYRETAPVYMCVEDPLDFLPIAKTELSACVSIQTVPSSLFDIENTALNEGQLICEVVSNSYGDYYLLIYSDHVYYAFDFLTAKMTEITILAALFNADKVKKICYNAPALYAYSQWNGLTLNNCEGILSKELAIRTIGSNLKALYNADDYYNRLDYIPLLSHYNTSKRYYHCLFAFNSTEEFNYYTFGTNERKILGHVRISAMAGLPLYSSVLNTQEQFLRALIKELKVEPSMKEAVVSNCSFQNMLMGKALSLNRQQGQRFVRGDVPGSLVFALKSKKDCEVAGIESTLSLSCSQANTEENIMMEYLRFLYSSNKLGDLPVSIVELRDNLVIFSCSMDRNLLISFFANQFRLFCCKNRRKTLSLKII